MTAPQCVDPASDVVTHVIAILRDRFDPDGPCPPEGGGTTEVRFLVGDAESPGAAWAQRPDCKGPFLWVRVGRRYRSHPSTFPKDYVANRNCQNADAVRVLEVEVGVARCVSMDAKPKRDKLDDEAEISFADSRRIEQVLTCIAQQLGSKQRAVATDSVAVFGPEGGVTAWSGLAYIQY